MMPPAPPPPGGGRRPAPAAGPPPPASSSSGGRGKAPAAHRTRSSKAPPQPQTQPQRPRPPSSSSSAPPPSSSSRPPPPVGGVGASAGTGASAAFAANPSSSTANPADPVASSLAVDDAIARRRAELRRLQNARGGVGIGARLASGVGSGKGAAGGKVGGLAAARSRLGLGLGARKGAGAGTGAGMGRLVRSSAVSTAAALVNRSKPPQPSATASTPAGAPPPRGGAETPSPADVARRLDASYGPPKQRAATTSAGMQPKPQSKPPTSKPRPSRFDAVDESAAAPRPEPVSDNSRRTSEIFEVGKKQRSNNSIGSSSNNNTNDSGAVPKPTAPAAKAPPSPAARSSAPPAAGKSPASPTRSPFGQARATASPLVPLTEGAPAPPLVPTIPIAAVPPLVEEPAASATEEPTGSGSKMAAGGERAREPEGGIDSGKSTPVHSNARADAVAAAKKELQEQMDRASPRRGGGGGGIDVGDEPTSSGASRLLDDLRRAEREKAEALEQVDRLRSQLEKQLQTQLETERMEKPLTPSEAGKASLPPGLVDKLQGVISARGEEDAVAWISQRLDGEERGGRSPRDREPRGGRLEGVEDLLSSVLPPLTPRSRPGSRAASPERGGGGGWLASQSLGRGADDVDVRGKRMTTPLPKIPGKKGAGSGGERSGASAGAATGPEANEGEEVEREYLVQAARSIPHEYGTRLASYFVRRPYVATDEEQASYSHMSGGGRYLANSTAYDPSSLEVVARVDADGSVFTLRGRSDARHGRMSTAAAMGGTGGVGGEPIDARAEEESLDWATFDDVEGRERALGRVTYIDAEGNEREYWLDSIYEEAMTTRESYCMSMISAAFALKEVTGGGVRAMASPMAATAQPAASTIPHHGPMRPPTSTLPPASPVFETMPPNATLPAQTMPKSPVRAGPSYVPMQQQPPILPGQMQEGTSNLPPPQQGMSAPYVQPPDLPPVQPKPGVVPPKEKESQQSQPSPDSDKKQPAKAKQLPPEDESYESADSALPFLVISLFSLFFSVAWFFVRIPFKIGSAMLTFFATVVALHILWLFLADDGGAWEMGAGVPYEYNMPGIY